MATVTTESEPEPDGGAERGGHALPVDLARPAAYPEPRPGEVTLATTHASWVFLAGDDAWKVKRPVSYGFLDYSDADKRRRSCEDEVRLGARLAPDVYLGVAPVFLGPAGFSFVGPGSVADTAVRMRRLPEEESALALVRAGRLGPGHIDALCERLAGFYATAPRADAHGAPAALAAAIDENYRQTLAYAGRFVARALIDRLVAEQRRALAAAEDALRGRVRAGRIREGHGDLRLEHVYFLSRLGGAPVVIDPIEFNAAFRCQDAALDVAFLAMELEAEGRRDLGCYVLGRFAQASNDYGLYPLADLYLGYRAWVRAKVACLVAADAGTPSDKAERKAAEAARLFALAETFARPRPRTGTLVVVGGMIGAGKSTVAHALGLALGAPVISSDVTRKALAGVAATSLEGAALYTERATARTYREMLHRADLVLGSGRDVILDGTFRTARSRRAARELALGHGCRLLFVAVDADDDTLRERLRARVGTASVSDARADLLPWLRRHYQPPVELAPAELLPVDGRTPVGATVDGIVDALVDPARAPVGG